MPSAAAPLFGPLACVVMGLAALAAPAAFAAQTGLVAATPVARSEARAVFGGVFLGLAAACLALASPAAYWVGAATFAGGAAAKVLSALLERGVFPPALPGLLVDLAAAALFVWGARALG